MAAGVCRNARVSNVDPTGAEASAGPVPPVPHAGYRKHVKRRVAFPIVPTRPVEMTVAVEVAASVLLAPSVSRGVCAQTVLRAASAKHVVTMDVVVRVVRVRLANHVMRLVHANLPVSRSVLANSAVVMAAVGPVVSVLLD